MPSPLPHPALPPHDGISGSDLHRHSDSYYTNEDITIVHHVVTTAQEILDLLPERERVPTHALFKACDAVLPTYGIDPENDKHISRLVFRIGGERSNGTLDDKFRSVLSRMGIELQFDTGPVSVGSMSGDDDGVSADKLHAVESSGGRRPRRNSDTGVEDTSHAIVEGNIVPRLRSLSLSEREGDGMERLSARMKARGGFPVLEPSHVIKRDPYPGHISPSTRGDTERSQQSPRSLLGSDGHRGASDTTVPTLDEVGSSKEPLEGHARELNERAARFRGHHMASNARHLFREWNGFAVGLQSVAEDISSACRESQAETLLQTWLAAAKERARERQRRLEDVRKADYYRRCDRLAARARDIYLITTTFAQWQELASEKADRTAIARRHILRLRHFDSWKEITLNEEHLVRSFVKGTYLPRWIRYYQSLQLDDARALVTYRQNLVATTFRDWFFLHLEEEATQHMSRRLMRTSFRQWLGGAQLSEREERFSSDRYQQSLLAKCFARWQGVAGFWMGPEAVTKGLVHCGTATQVFRCWFALTGHEMDMERLCQSRRLILTFGTWNTEAKIRRFRQQSDYRLVSETFCQWLFLEQLTTFEARRDRALMEQTFDYLLRRSQELREAEREPRLRSAALGTRARAAAVHFQSWWDRARCVCTRGCEAGSHHGQVEMIKHLNVWYEAAMQVDEMDRWARRGEFYLIVDKDFGAWKNSAKAEKERKLRIAYARAKHGANTRLVLRCWNEWRAQGDMGEKITAKACNVCHNSDVQTVAAAVDLWASSLGRDVWLEQCSQLLTTQSFLSLWIGAAAEYASTEDEAWAVWAERMAGSCWQRWNIAFQWVEGQEYNSSKAQQRLRKNALQEAFVQWKWLASNNRAGSQEMGDALFGRNESVSTAGWRFLPKPRAWARSALSDYNVGHGGRPREERGLDAESVVGTMETPTRWTGVQGLGTTLASTTPSNPLPTPYERELRARYDGHPALTVEQRESRQESEQWWKGGSSNDNYNNNSKSNEADG